MSEEDPKRLRDGGGDGGDGVRSLIEAGRSEVPSDRQLTALAAKIGIAGGLGGAGAAGAGGGGAGAGAAGAGAKGAAGAASAIKAGLAVKVVALVAIAGVAGVGAVGVTSARRGESAAPVGIVATEAPRANADASADANADANASADANANASVDADASADADANGATARAVTPKVRPAGSPEDEIKLVTRAQAALRGGRPDQALAFCNDHARQYPNGIVTQECEVIAVEALVKTGRKDEARQRAERFKARFPGSAAIRRLDVLLGE